MGRRFRVVEAPSKSYKGVSGEILGFTRRCLVYTPPRAKRPRILPLKGLVIEVEGEPVEGDSLLLVLGREPE